MRNNHKVAAKSKNLYLKASSPLQWSRFPLTNHFLYSRDFTQMNELCEKARHLFFHLFRWDLIHYAYQKWKLMSPLEGCFTKPFLQIFSVPDGSGGPCLSLQPVWSPGERNQPGGTEYSKKEMNQVAGITIF